MRFPSITAVRIALADVRDDVRGPNWPKVDGDDWTEVRLQVYPDGAWAIRVGLSDYDLDHRGYWGAGTVSATDKLADLDDLARSMLDEAKEAHAMAG